MFSIHLLMYILRKLLVFRFFCVFCVSSSLLFPVHWRVLSLMCCKFSESSSFFRLLSRFYFSLDGLVGVLTKKFSAFVALFVLFWSCWAWQSLSVWKLWAFLLVICVFATPIFSEWGVWGVWRVYFWSCLRNPLVVVLCWMGFLLPS